jgi:putative transcriptional regulator
MSTAKKSMMTCSMCDNSKSLKGEKITHKYKESGLDNVTLIGIEKFHCDQCGEEYFSYGNIEKLHTAIAHVLLRKKDLLTGLEVRFLRKHLGYSGAMFAKLIGYDDATLSRLETGANPITRTFDHLVRFSVASKIPNRNYDLHDQILTGGGVNTNRIQLKAMPKGEWELKAA